MYRIITIERQFASGGSEIGKRLSRELDMKLYDRNILVMAAAKLEIPPSYMENLEETGPGSILLNLSRTVLGGAGLKDKEGSLPLTERLFQTEKDILQNIIQTENCIIIGRAASFLLKDRPDCLRVFIHAGLESRRQRALEHEGCQESNVDSVLRKNDKRRQGFYEYHTAQKWGNPENFDLCLDSSRLGIERCIEIIKTAVNS